MRSNYCNEITKDLVGTRVNLCGWVHRRRDHGGVIFFDLRDTTGLVQLVINPEIQSFAIAESVRNEYVLKVSGEVNLRPEESKNEALGSGDVEVVLSDLQILNTAKTPAFPLDNFQEISEEVRLKNRLLDLRRPEMQKNIRTKSRLTSIIRSFLETKGFLDIETPILTKATPEGARDYLVPSRTSTGSFFALPQSPQLFKQMLMISGFDKYYQVARCFRDEDLRADRQPEFSQIDIEASFIDEKEIMNLSEEMIKKCFVELLNVNLGEVPRLSWCEAIELYGTDKPDLRNPLKLFEIKDIFLKEEFKVFSDPANDPDSRIASIILRDGDDIGRGQIDRYTDFVKEFGAKGLAYIRVKGEHPGDLDSPIGKYLSEECKKTLIKELDLKKGDLVLFGAGKKNIVNDYMSRLIEKLGADRNLLRGEYCSCWITDFPMFEKTFEKEIKSLHHPFTCPDIDDLDKLKKLDKLEMNSKAYDFVINGIEIGGGSIRIHNSKVQHYIFELLGIDKQERKEKFGFFLDSLESGCPPHGGIAFGLDRLAMIMLKAETIRDVIPFPKTQSALCLITEAPSMIPDENLQELNIKRIED